MSFISSAHLSLLRTLWDEFQLAVYWTLINVPHIFSQTLGIFATRSSATRAPRPATVRLHFLTYSTTAFNLATIYSQKAPPSFLFVCFIIFFLGTISQLSQEGESLKNYSLADFLFFLPPTQRAQQAKHLRLLLLEKNNSAIVSTSDFRHLEFGKAHLYLLHFRRGAEESGKLSWQH